MPLLLLLIAVLRPYRISLHLGVCNLTCTVSWAAHSSAVRMLSPRMTSVPAAYYVLGHLYRQRITVRLSQLLTHYLTTAHADWVSSVHSHKDAVLQDTLGLAPNKDMLLCSIPRICRITCCVTHIF